MGPGLGADFPQGVPLYGNETPPSGSSGTADGVARVQTESFRVLREREGDVAWSYAVGQEFATQLVTSAANEVAAPGVSDIAEAVLQQTIMPAIVEITTRPDLAVAFVRGIRNRMDEARRKTRS